MNILLTANGAPGEITLALAAEYLTGARVLRAYDRARARARAGATRPCRAILLKFPFRHEFKWESHARGISS